MNKDQEIAELKNTVLELELQLAAFIKLYAESINLSHTQTSADEIYDNLRNTFSTLKKEVIEDNNNYCLNRIWQNPGL